MQEEALETMTKRFCFTNKQLNEMTVKSQQ